MSYGPVCFCGHYDTQHPDGGACEVAYGGLRCKCEGFDKAPEWEPEALQMLAAGRPVQPCTIHKLWFLTLCRRCHPEEYLAAAAPA